MTVESFCNWLESSGFKDGERLPSVREVSKSLGTSTFTVFRAYKKMVGLGKVYGEHGNGYFWGRKPEIAVALHEREGARLERLLLDAWKSGKISADSPLPTRLRRARCGAPSRRCGTGGCLNVRAAGDTILPARGLRLAQRKFCLLCGVTRVEISTASVNGNSCSCRRCMRRPTITTLRFGR